MDAMVVALDVSKLSGWLNADPQPSERTENMYAMLVTLEVFQPEMSALKFHWSLKSCDMSVMPETSQSAMGPYCAMAEPVLRLNSLTAACRAVLAAKVVGGGSGGDSGGKGGGEGARPGG